LQETEVVNGDMGICRDVVITDRGAWAVVAFRNPDRLCRLPLNDCHLQPGFAITVHSAQGSGFKYVIMPVHPSFYFDSRRGIGLWCRELFYTMLSRVEKLGATVGQRSAIPMAVARQTLHKRQTMLVERLRQAAAQPEMLYPAEPEVMDFNDEEDDIQEMVSEPMPAPLACQHDSLDDPDSDLRTALADDEDELQSIPVEPAPAAPSAPGRYDFDLPF
jgi:hypothetical protein